MIDESYGMNDKNYDLNVTEQNTSASKTNNTMPEIHPVNMEPPKGPKDLKRILKCSKVIDEIFNKRTSKIDA